MRTDTDCTTTKAQATERAKHLQSLIKFKGFKVKVWDNIGYHYLCSNGLICVYPSGTRWTAILPNHYTHWGDVVRSKDPNRAITLLVRQVLGLVKDYVEFGEALRDSVKKKK